MKDKHIEFIFNTNADQVFMNIDTVKVESVFNNLLSNACKFTNSGDSIILSLEYNSENNSVEIKLSDTGVGIPKQDLPYIFQRFFQSPANSKGKDGTGIGLFLVKNYIELHGGKVNVISEMGEGTTFTVWLPVMESNVESKPIDKNSLNDLNGKQLIAIVEDNVAISEFIYNIFTPEYRCIIAHNGKTGLKACMELNPDIIIADVMMPVLDGLEMARRLKNHIPTSTIPLVFLTAKDDKETELKSIELNIEAFIAKPFDSTILYSRVKQILKNRKLLEKKARIEQLASPKMEKAESLDEKFLAKVTRTIEDKMADPGLNVNVLCELADTSPKQLYRKIKQLTGLTAVDYIKSIRLKKAAMYLSNKNFTIAEVMYMVGFSNHSYFSKCFQAKFSITPRQFIEQQQQPEIGQKEDI
jgi:CheY-like chemotaxis protein